HQDFLAQFPVAFLQLLAKKSEWQRFIRFAERQETGNSECDNLLKHSNTRWDGDSLRGIAIRVLARSEELSQEETKVQQVVSDFLHRYLVAQREAAQRQHVQTLHKYLS